MGDVHDSLALVLAAEQLSSDVIVSDVSMPGLDGDRRSHADPPEEHSARIVFVTVHCDPLLMERGFETGALGYVRKAAAGEELMNAVRSALRGERHTA